MMVRIYLKVYKVKSMSVIENLVNKYDKKVIYLRMEFASAIYQCCVVSCLCGEGAAKRTLLKAPLLPY